MRARQGRAPRGRPAKDAVWVAVAEELGGRFTPAQGRRPTAIRLDHGAWPVQLAVQVVQMGSAPVTVTRCTVEGRSRGTLRFRVTRAGRLAGLVRRFAVGRVPLSNPRLDAALDVRTNDPSKIRSLLNDPAISEPLLVGPRLRVRLERPGWLRRRRVGQRARTLVVETDGRIQEPAHLKGMVAVATATIDRLAGMGLLEPPGPV